MINLLKDFWQIINSATITPEVWAVIVQTLVVAITLSPLAQFIKKIIMHYKKWLDDPRRRELVMNTALILSSFIGAALMYLRTDPYFAEWIVLLQGVLTYAATQPFYIYFLKPLTLRIGAGISNQIAKAHAVNEARAAALPATGLPINNEEEF